MVLRNFENSVGIFGKTNFWSVRNFSWASLCLKDSNLSKDMAMFNQEIGRLTKERDTAKTELEVSTL